MDLFKRGKKEESVREELAILSTTIESINQQLRGGGEGGVDRHAIKLLQEIDRKLHQIYEQDSKNSQNVISYTHALVAQEGKKIRDHVNEQAELLNGAMLDRFEKVEALYKEQLRTQNMILKYLHKLSSEESDSDDSS